MLTAVLLLIAALPAAEYQVIEYQGSANQSYQVIEYHSTEVANIPIEPEPEPDPKPHVLYYTLQEYKGRWWCKRPNNQWLVHVDGSWVKYTKGMFRTTTVIASPRGSRKAIPNRGRYL